MQKVYFHREEYLLGRTAHSARYEKTIHDRTGQPVSENLQGKTHFENFIMGSEITEFVNKVKDQVRIRQKIMSNDAEDCTEYSIIWGMFMTTTLNAATFMGKNYSTMQNVVQNEENLTLKQMFDITAQTIHNEEEIYCLDKVVYQKNSWTQLSLINDSVVINPQNTKVHVFSDSVLCIGKVRAEKSYKECDAVSGRDERIRVQYILSQKFTNIFMIQKATEQCVQLHAQSLTFIETTVTNCVNGTTHTDELTDQH